MSIGTKRSRIQQAGPSTAKPEDRRPECPAAGSVNDKLKPLQLGQRLQWREQAGITGVPTAITVIAVLFVGFVAVQVAFAVLSTELFRREKAMQTALSGLDDNTNALQPKGAIIAEESIFTADSVDNIKFKLTNSAGANAVGLAPSTTVVTYSDQNNFVNAVYTCTGNANIPFLTADVPTVCCDNLVGWGQDWILGTGDNVDPGEILEITLNIRRLGLGANTPFKIEIIPGQGEVITIERTTPPDIRPIMDLD